MKAGSELTHMSISSILIPGLIHGRWPINIYWIYGFQNQFQYSAHSISFSYVILFTDFYMWTMFSFIWVWQHQNLKRLMRARGKAQVEWDSPEHVSHERLISIGPTHTPRLLVCAHLVVWLARGHNHTSSSTLSACVLRFSLRRRMKDEQNSVSLSDCFWDYAFQMSLLSQFALVDILYRKSH